MQSWIGATFCDKRIILPLFLVDVWHSGYAQRSALALHHISAMQQKSMNRLCEEDVTNSFVDVALGFASELQ